MSNILPVDLQREILSYVSHLDKLEYARCNRSLCGELLTQLRIITIRKERREFLSSEAFRNKILGLIGDPYKQLELDYDYFDNPIEISENNLLGLKVVLRTLFIDIQDFPLLFPHLAQIEYLLLKWERRDINVTIPQISGLRKLSLISYPKSSLSSLKDDVQLNQRLDLGSLRLLKLIVCRSLADVSCLGHIYELHLMCCDALIDISCLNHNEIIVIDSCPVQDYSQSFRFSRVITVILSKDTYQENHLLIKGINLDNLEAVQTLTISYDYMDIPDPLSCRESLPSSLRCLCIQRSTSRLLVPQNHSLKKISFSECEDVSLENLEKITFVTIERCHNIIDWSPLQDNQNVELRICVGFKSGKQLSNVKKLTLLHWHLNSMMDLINITHLKLEKEFYCDENDPYVFSIAQEKKLFSSAMNLQEIEFEVNCNLPSFSLLNSIMESPQHKRIVITLFKFEKSNLKAFHQQIVKDFGSLYEVEMKLHDKIVLLKREQKRGNLLLFSLFLISLGIIPIFAYFLKPR